MVAKHRLRAMKGGCESNGCGGHVRDSALVGSDLSDRLLGFMRALDTTARAKASDHPRPTTAAVR
jgi:hypothetical protein